MSTYTANLARLRVAASTGVLPEDLARWALEVAEEAAPAIERVQARNALLSQAAALVSGSPWAKARRLEREVEALRAHPALRERAADDGVRDLVARALEVDPRMPGSARHLFRLLTD